VLLRKHWCAGVAAAEALQLHGTITDGQIDARRCEDKHGARYR